MCIIIIINIILQQQWNSLCTCYISIIEHPLVNLLTEICPKQNIPTVYPTSPFDARADADALHYAMKGFGTDENVLINILCHRTRDQRTAISHAYKAGYGKVKTSSYSKSVISCSLPLPASIADIIFLGLGDETEKQIEFKWTLRNTDGGSLSSCS